MKQKGKLPAVVGCLAVQLCAGILYVWSIFRQSAIDYYGWSTAAVDLVSGLMLFCFCLGGMIGGAWADRIGPRRMAFIGMPLFGAGVLLSSMWRPGAPIGLFYFSYCLIAGASSGMTYGPMLCCVQRWFPERRGLATGLASGAFGFSTVVFAPLVSRLLASFELPVALRILGIVFLAVGICACLLIRAPEEQPAGAMEPDNSLTLRQAIRTPPFWLLALMCFFYNGTWNMLNPLVKSLGIERGLSAGAATVCVSLTGLMNASGRLLMSLLSDRIGRLRTLALLCGATALAAAGLIGAVGGAYFAFILLASFAYGGPAGVTPAAMTDYFGPSHAGSKYGIVMLAVGISSVTFNALSSALRAATGGYTAAFLVGAATAVLAAAAVAAVAKLLRKKQ